MARVEQHPSPARHSQFADSDYLDQADFRCALRKFLRFAEERARVHGITPQQHLMLLVVRGHRSYPGVTIGQVAEGLQIRHHAASLLIDRGVRRGLLIREEDPNDRRRALLTLTEEGQRILDQITEENRRELAQLDDVLFRRSLVDAIQKYAESGEHASA
ncbi:MAG TPA: MarR family transcriptional regulator [Chloroflexota bacterium]|nr:MarR family transcriptional regulator [Chloroflexota bacterium]